MADASPIVRPDQLAQAPRPWRPEELPTRERTTRDIPEPPSGMRGVDALAATRAAREQGLAEGIRAGEESYRAKLTRLEALAETLRAERAEFFERIEPELVRLAVSIAEKIIGRELELNPDTVLDVIRGAVRRLRDREMLRVSVHPRDVARVREAREDLISAVDGVRKLEVVEDRRVDIGGCVIETPNGTLDARIRTQMDEIGRVLEETIPGAGPDAEGSAAGPEGGGGAEAGGDDGRPDALSAGDQPG